MTRIEELEQLKDMYTQDLEELYMFETNSDMYELRRHELEFRIMSIEDTIVYLKEQKQSKRQFKVILIGVVLIILSFIYLIS
jgi:hypothetical protein